MNIQTKSSLIIIFTLLIGITVGLIGRGLMQPPPPKLQPGGIRPEIFIDHFERILDVKGENKDTVRSIIENRFESFLLLNNEHRMEIDSLMDDLFMEVEPLLNKEELLRLNNHREEMRQRPTDGRGLRPPGGAQHPPLRNGSPPPPPPRPNGK